MITKLIKKILIIFLFFGCENNDDGLYPYKNNYHRVEFDIIKNNYKDKKIGVATLGVVDKETLDDTEIHFQGIYKGEYSIISPECNVNHVAKYRGLEKVKLKNLINNPNSNICLLKIKFKSDFFKDYRYSYEETAEIYLTFENFYKNFSIEYYNLENSKKYYFLDNSAIQLRSKINNTKNKITINNNTIKPWEYFIKGCGTHIDGVANTSKLNVSFEKIFNKIELDRNDSCLLSIEIKNFDNNSQKIFLFLSFFDAEVKKLSNLNYGIIEDKIVVNGLNFSNICSINDRFILFTCPDGKVICSEKYDPEKIYWLREITLKGRKNIIGIKNGQLIWEE